MCVLSWKDTLWIVDGIALFMMLPRRIGCFSMSRHVASCGRVLCSCKEGIFPNEQSVCPSNMSAALGGLVRSPLDLNEARRSKTDGVGISWGGVFLSSVEITL